MRTLGTKHSTEVRVVLVPNCLILAQQATHLESLQVTDNSSNNNHVYEQCANGRLISERKQYYDGRGGRFVIVVARRPARNGNQSGTTIDEQQQ